MNRLTLLAVLCLTVIAPPAQAAEPEAAYHPSTALVAFAPELSGPARAAMHAALGSAVVNTMDWMHLDVVRVADGVDPADAVARYRALPGVRYAGVNRVVRAFSDDLLFGDQWGMHNTGQPVGGSLIDGAPDADIDAPEGWSAAFGAGAFESSGGTRVAVLDTGIDRAHADLLGKVKACASATSAVGVVVNGTCDDDGAHGTHTAGIVGALTNNTVGVAGTAPNAELSIFKFLNAAGVGFLADEIAAIRWAYTTGQAKVLSMSFGSTDPDDAEQLALKDAAAAGAILIAAAGNDYDATRNYPAYYPEVMSVAATNAADRVAEFSTCNGDVEIAAPGEDIWSTTPGNSYAILSGTSMATPMVAGVAALVMSEKGFTAQQTRTQLKNTAVSLTGGGNGRSACNSYQRVNLWAALGGSTTPPPPGPGSIAGAVTEQKTGTAIAAATVSCGAAGTATTASDGTYSLTAVPSGSYTCTASKTGYASKSATVTVNAEQTTTQNFVLRKR